MAKQVQWRRGTTAENDVFVGANGEITIDTDQMSLRIHDGVNAGGWPVSASIAGGTPFKFQADPLVPPSIFGPWVSTPSSNGPSVDLRQNPMDGTTFTQTSTGITGVSFHDLPISNTYVAGDFFAVTGLLANAGFSTSDFAMGVHLGDSAGNRMVFGFTSSNIWVAKYSDANTLVSEQTYFPYSSNRYPTPFTLMLKQSTGVFQMYVCLDGQTEDVIFEEAIGTFLTGNLTKYGVTIRNTNNTSRLACFSLRGDF